MSLFRAREWWSTKLGHGEEFDRGSMTLGNVDNDTDGSVKIITGSFQGMLRVHHPVKEGFRIEDLLLEQDLGAPILQVSVGRFIPAAPRLKAIAVLHPRKLGVYTVEAVGGRGGKASFFNLVKSYEHALGSDGGGHFTSCNMTHGGFGGVSRDLLCVQSMDGRLQVFEQDAHAFTRRLNGIFAPGPICYVQKIDAFVVGNSEMGVDCYKYQALAASQEDRQEGKSEGISRARGLQAYWSCQLGESVLDVFVAKFSRALGPGNVDIVVVGERTLFTLREQGTIRLQKILGYQPACACKYVVVAAPGEEGARLTGTTVREIDDGFDVIVEEENLIIGADTDQLMVYKDLQLVWQATVTRAPVTLVVAKLGAMSGMVCSLDQEGVLSACYQGTDPPTSAVAAMETKEMDYEQINQEHRELLQVIRRSQTDSARPLAGKLTLNVQVPRFLDDPGTQQQQRRQGDGWTPPLDDGAQRGYFGEASQASSLSTDSQEKQPNTLTVRFVVSYSGPSELRDATLNVCLPRGISAEPSSVLLPPIQGTGNGGRAGAASDRGDATRVDPVVVTVVLRAERRTGCMPSSLVGQASVVCIGQGATDQEREPISARCDIRLPLALVARVVETSKAGAHKFTLNTNHPPVLISELFEDMVHSSQASGGSLSKRRPLEDSKMYGVGEGPVEPDEGSDSRNAVVGDAMAALSLRYWAVDSDATSNQDVTVAVSKNSGRYRVQSESLAAICVVATEVVRRLNEYFGESAERNRSEARSANGGKTRNPGQERRLQVEYGEALPLQEFYGIIDEHLERRRDLQRVSETLNCAAHQYRVVEKRLLSRFKDRNPSPLNNLDTVSEETFLRLVDLGDEVERVQRRLDVGAADLSCAVRLVALLAQCRFQLSFKDHALLVAHLCPDATDTDDQGWEESVDAAMTHLLRTSLAKVAKHTVPAGSLGQPPLSMPTDTVKLKKHISIVFDRLNKGARLAIRPAAPPSSPRRPKSPDSSMSPSPRGSPRGPGRGFGVAGAGGQAARGQVM